MNKITRDPNNIIKLYFNDVYNKFITQLYK